MVKFSKYLKKYAKTVGEDKPEKKQEKETPSPAPSEDTAPKQEKKEPQKTGFPKVPLDTEAMAEKDKGLSVEIYQEAIEFIQELMKKIREEGAEAVLPGNEALRIVGKIVDRLALRDPTLISQSSRALEGHYLPSHSVNVCVLSVLLGLGMNYNKSKLTHLGLSALLHDVGLMSMGDITEKEGKLSKEEYERMRTHPSLGVEIISRMEGVSGHINPAVIEQHHERKDGGGYPKKLAGEGIDELAGIVGLVDVYEATTHARAYSDKDSPHEAIRDIVKSQSGLFDDELIRLLIEELSIYPVGSLVRLNTGAIARVAAATRGFPLRPRVEVIFEPDGQQAKKLTAIDLKREPRIHIVRPVEEGDLNEKTEKS